MLHHRLLAMSVLCLLAVSGCGAQDSHDANLEGHYEGTTSANMRNFAGGQTVVPEYNPVGGVVIALPLLTSYGKEQMVRDIVDANVDTIWVTASQNFSGSLQSSVFNPLRRVLGEKFSRVKLVKQNVPGSVSVWSRDWAPLGARSKDGRLRLIDFNYYPERRADDATARSLLSLMPVPRVSVPVYNEGGNFMNNNRGVCMMTSRVTDANAVRHFTDDMTLSADQIRSLYQQYAGCLKTHIFPRMPYEGTGHIDMWAKFMNDSTVIVGEVRAEILKLSAYSQSQVEKVQAVKTYLDRRAAEIRNLGYRVVRMPMPAPIPKQGGWMFRSYTNSLTVNQLALVPRYLKPYYSDLGVNGEYMDRSLLARYESEVIGIYQSLGYRFKWVNSDDVIAAGGAVHCTTMQLPR